MHIKKIILLPLVSHVDKDFMRKLNITFNGILFQYQWSYERAAKLDLEL